MALGGGVGLGQGWQTQMLAGSGVGPRAGEDMPLALTHRSPARGSVGRQRCFASWRYESVRQSPVLQVGNELKTEHTQFRPNRNLWGLDPGHQPTGGRKGGRGGTLTPWTGGSRTGPSGWRVETGWWQPGDSATHPRRYCLPEGQGEGCQGLAGRPRPCPAPGRVVPGAG